MKRINLSYQNTIIFYEYVSQGTLQAENKTNVVFITDGYANEKIPKQLVSSDELKNMPHVTVINEGTFLDTQFHAVLYGRNPKLDSMLDYALHGSNVCISL